MTICREGHNIWRREQAERFSVVVDADDYFQAAREAFLQAKKRIMLVGWDFDARIRLTNAERLPGEPETVGEFLYWLVEQRPELELYLLRWDLGALKTLTRGTTVFTVFKWMRHPRIHTKLDSHHPTGASHHQKIVSIDDCIAFCGGIDMTGDRWDTRSHRDHDPGRTTPGGEPYKPWHDATAAVTGPAAAALGEACRNRWAFATGDKLDPVGPVEGTCWPDRLTPMFTDIQVGIARSRPEMPDCAPVHEIEALFLEQIASATRWIYCESQYFASRRVAEAIAARLKEPNGPEIVIVNPVNAQGWLEPLAMDTARARLMQTLWQLDTFDRLRLYHPVTSGGAHIYVHAKITIVDDRQLRIGSANLNNRSMRLDTECDVIIEAEEQEEERRAVIASVRDSLLGEHLDVPPERVAELLTRNGSLIQTIEQLRRPGRSLIPYEVPDLDAVEKWLAENEVLDPEGPAEMFESLSERGLFRRLRKPR